MRTWSSRWYCAGWGTVGFMVLLSGIVSSRVDLMVSGAVFLFAAASAYLTFHVKSEHRLKRTSEVIFMLLALGSVICGYFATESLILGIATLFTTAMILFAFIVSYLVPKMRNRARGYSQDV